MYVVMTFLKHHKTLQKDQILIGIVLVLCLLYSIFKFENWFLNLNFQLKFSLTIIKRWKFTCEGTM